MLARIMIVGVTTVLPACSLDNRTLTLPPNEPRGEAGSTGSDAGCGSIALCSDPPAMNEDCNLACQTGCPCGERCNITATGPRCVSTSAQAKTLGQVCNLTNGGVAGFDNCAPGLVCLKEMCGALSRCYRFCSSNAQCGSLSCNIPIDQNNGQPNNTAAATACEVPRQDCDPVAQTGCPSGMACFLLNDGSTLCDCPSAAPGGDGAACLLYYDCNAGLTCVPSPIGGAVCRPICSTIAPNCGMGRTCSASAAANTKLGFCGP